MRIPGLSVDTNDQSLPWKETRVPGVKWLPLQLHDQPTEGRTSATSSGSSSAERAGATVLIRMEPGAGYGAHRHLGSEDVLVLSGGYRDEFGEYRSGEHVHYAPGSSHTPVALGDSSKEISPENPVCTLFAVASGGIELLERDESPA